MDASPPPLDEVDHQRTLAAVQARMFGASPSFPCLDRFVVLGNAGEGAMGRVYIAYDPKLDRKVAIKVIRIVGDHEVEQHRRHRLEREAQAAAKIAHPNVIAIHEVGTTGDDLFVVMEYVAGPTLRQWLAAEDRGWRARLTTLIAAGRGLAAAHQLGLVHRDFKPDNVLVGDDGRVRVVDFGLVRLVEATEESAAPYGGATPRAEVTPYATTTGASMGTPAYMSPEQASGEAVDARSDQFSFCVALHEALYGERPKAITDGKTRPPPSDNPHRVPPTLHRILARGLAASAEARHPSMEALLDALAREADPGRRGWMLAAAAGLLGGAVWLGTALGEAEPCPDAAVYLASTWDEPTAGAVRASLQGTGLIYATATADHVDQALGEYADAWIRERNAACTDTRVTGEQPESVLVARLSCLTDRKRQLAAVVALLSHADATIAENATRATAGLPSVAQCSDLAYVQAAVAPPDGEHAQAALEQIRDGLAQVDAQRLGGKYESVEGTIDTLLADAEALAYPPAIATALVARGRLDNEQGRYAEYEAAMRRAFYVATAAGDDPTATEAALELVYSPGRVTEAAAADLQWGELAAALIERRDGDPAELRVRLAASQGRVLHARGDYEGALKQYGVALSTSQASAGGGADASAIHNYVGASHTRLGSDEQAVLSFRQAADLGAQLHGEQHPRTGTALSNLATALYRLGELGEATTQAQRALAIFRGAYPNDHPNVAMLLGTLGALHLAQGDKAAALQQFSGVVDSLRRRYDAKHPQLASGLNNLGYVYGELGRYDEALASFDEALSIVAERPGSEEVASSILNNQGIVYKKQGRLSEALVVYERARSMTAAALGEEHRDVAGADLNVANVLLRLHRHDEARTRLDAAMAGFERAPGDNRVAISDVLHSIGSSARARGEARDAQDFLERALAMKLEVLGERHPGLAATQFELARALQDAPEATQRARALAQQARALLSAPDSESARLRAELDTWLAQHTDVP